ncbi:Heterokaryon incompatibility protein 6 [Lasiodiplodia theobromae]|nr:Heterokaryon incompatibility protein 6 [Lasiodiplodia theobromae]
MVQDQLNGDKSEETKYDPAQPSMFEKMIRTKQAEKRYTKEQKVWRTQVKPGLCIAKTCFHQDATYDRLARQDAGGAKRIPLVGPEAASRGNNNFSAATSMPESFSLSDDGRTLKTSAAVVDAVRFRLPVDGNWSASGGFCFWPVIRPYFIDKLGPDSIYKHTGERISTAFWRTLMDDMWNKKHPAPDRFEQYFAQCLAKLEGPAKASELLGLLYEPKASSFDFGGALLCTATARAFYVTEGGYYGLGPVTVRRGDKVLLLPGTQVPYLFREHMVKENSWMLIGETYVHGIMHGEALRKGLAFDPIDIV